MSLTNPNTPVSQQDLQDFYYRIKPYLGTDAMPAEDMDEIVTPKPNVALKLPILFDETGTERIVGWYKNSAGLKKPVYQKEIVLTNVTSGANITTFHTLIPANNDVEKIISCSGYWVMGDQIQTIPSNPNSQVGNARKLNASSAVELLITRTGNALTFNTISVSLQYTKTTDEFI